MRLFASNSNKSGTLDIIPENILLEIIDIKLREDSDKVYYVKVRDYKRQFIGWVSLGSLHYELLIGLDDKKTYTNSDGGIYNF